MPYVYLLRCRDGTLYAGAAVALAWSAEVESWSAALREEHRIKQLRRTEKEALIASA